MSERLFLRLDDDPLAGPETTAPSGTLRGFDAGEELRGCVAGILLYRETFAPRQQVIERVLPDGAVRLVFNFGDPPALGDAAGQPAAVVGASSTAALVQLRGRMEGISVTLRAGAAAALLGLPAGEIAGTAVTLPQLWGRRGAELQQRLGETADDAARVELIRAELRHRLHRAAEGPAQACMAAARFISAAGGRRPLREIAAAVGVGERRLQQLFQAHVGLSPRSWSRLARLHACLRLVRGARAPDWADLALRSGFYDQSHLVNEFRGLCGVTPTEYLGRAVSGSSNTPV
ncbi:helix-turn-helix domain-containing protein [Tahibacter harae]|uniref:Helix-turn-helix domain-containing protein n=1 Tax=Tahibacter harae TaxID=2963937 RepID=A0ABT1QUZ0_9GAMM|nr:helix-turn-helix domain-containing protein [Tahibacter harae]MCQ4166083.1 helix-turn-helix domain-containing protein [Tahibacter harae]